MLKKITGLMTVVVMAIVAFMSGVSEKAHDLLFKYMANTGMVLAMANIYSKYTYDAALNIRTLAAAITATETGAIILDIGNGLVDGDLVIDYSALDVVTGDECYAFTLEGSPDAAFGTAANIKALAQLTIGGATGLNAPNGVADAAAGRCVIPFRNERIGTTYRYVRLLTTLSGTTPSIVFAAFLAKDDD